MCILFTDLIVVATPQPKINYNSNAVIYQTLSYMCITKLGS